MASTAAGSDGGGSDWRQRAVQPSSFLTGCATWTIETSGARSERRSSDTMKLPVCQFNGTMPPEGVPISSDACEGLTSSSSTCTSYGRSSWKRSKGSWRVA